MLFISGSGGLGHVTRDLSIARELRKIDPTVEIVWLSEEPATRVLRDAKEDVLPEANQMFHGNKVAEQKNVETYTFNLFEYVRKLRGKMENNADVILDVVKREKPELVIGDEAYDLTFKFFADENARTFPFVMIYDFIGVDLVTKKPMDLISARYLNKKFVQFLTGRPRKIADKFLFVGVLEDIRDSSFGAFLPNRREVANQRLVMLGYVLPFTFDEVSDPVGLRHALGYHDGPLIICTKGGTKVGKPLLSLCARAYPFIKEKIPDVQMVIVCGPEIEASEIDAPEGVTVEDYVPQLYKHLACADICVTQGGGTTTLELTALQKPFVYFPLEEQWEQMTVVVDRCERLGAGIKMRYYETTPEQLADVIVANIGKTVKYDLQDMGGARIAAEVVNDMLQQIYH